jgi:hypothetical protein
VLQPVEVHNAQHQVFHYRSLDVVDSPAGRTLVLGARSLDLDRIAGWAVDTLGRQEQGRNNWMGTDCKGRT